MQRYDSSHKQANQACLLVNLTSGSNVIILFFTGTSCAGRLTCFPSGILNLSTKLLVHDDLSVPLQLKFHQCGVALTRHLSFLRAAIWCEVGEWSLGKGLEEMTDSLFPTDFRNCFLWFPRNKGILYLVLTELFIYVPLWF